MERQPHLDTQQKNGVKHLACAYYFFQKLGTIRTKKVKSSRRPSSIAATRTHFAASPKGAKLPEGPTISPSPGPTLEMVVPVADRAVMTSTPRAQRAMDNMA